ncbi:MAG: thiamine-phosphate kinase [Endozoicomonas sp.]
MALGEFDLIRTYFDRPELRSHRSDVLGIGDDCALLTVPSGMQLAQSLDTLVCGVHFPRNCDPFLLGYRALAVNLSDLAAMGAEPHSFTLGLTLSESDDQWLSKFSSGLAKLAGQAGISLIGGDTTCGPLTISIQAQGLVPAGQALLRSGARAGDHIYVSGSLGDAAGALEAVLTGVTPDTCSDVSVRHLLQRYYLPSPRLALGSWLAANGATSALDISDGLLGDLGHILSTSGVGAEIDPGLIPLSKPLLHTQGEEQARQMAMTGGDDYELCFTWPADKPLELPGSIAEDCTVTRIGRITVEAGLRDSGSGNELTARAYQHF